MKHGNFEFGVSLNEIEFIQNEDEWTEQECHDILTKLMGTGKFETHTKTFGMVIWVEKSGEYEVLTRPFIIDGWDWDFDHEDTSEVRIKL